MVGQRDAVRLLLESPPASLVHKVQGRLPLDDVCEKWARAGLIHDDVNVQASARKLQMLLSACLEHGLGSYVLDYVREVSLDDRAVSSDPEEHILMGIDVVARWAREVAADVYERCRRCAEDPSPAQLRSALSAGETARGLHPVATSLAAAETSSPPPQTRARRPAAAPQARETLAHAARRTLQASQFLEVLRWADAHKLTGDRFLAEWGSVPSWKAKVLEREAGGKRSPGLARLKQACAARALAREQDAQPGAADADAARDGPGQGASAAAEDDSVAVRDAAYPPSSLASFAGAAMLGGDTAPAVRQAKLSLVLYALVDAGHEALAGSFCAALGLGEDAYAHVHAAVLLDQARGAGEAERAQLAARAGRLLLDRGASDLPFAFVADLKDLGLSDVAAQLLRVLGMDWVAGPEGAADEQDVAMAVRLDCGLLHEAFAGLRAACKRGLPREAAGRLVQKMCAWGHANGKIDVVFALPWEKGSVEERALREWATAQGRGAKLEALYLLSRGRAAEVWRPPTGTGAADTGGEDADMDVDGSDAQMDRAFAALLTTSRSLVTQATQQAVVESAAEAVEAQAGRNTGGTAPPRQKVRLNLFSRPPTTVGGSR
ncbi:unnamed protein product [Pedinophyceae sp. YPF-701]|nr:unnamed protein product [Pedinophyceae sp. YPF-701]